MTGAKEQLYCHTNLFDVGRPNSALFFLQVSASEASQSFFNFHYMPHTPALRNAGGGSELKDVAPHILALRRGKSNTKRSVVQIFKLNCVKEGKTLPVFLV